MKTYSLKFFWLSIFFLMILFFYHDVSLSQSVEEIKINVKTISEDYPTLTTNLQIPFFEGFGNEQIKNRITTIIETDIFSFLEELRSDSEKYFKKAKEEKWMPKKYIGETIFELHYLSKKMISFSIIYYSYTLGAHGFTERVSYNFDLETGNEIKIEDLFLDYNQYMDLINHEIKRQIDAEKELYFNEGKDFQSIKDWQQFYIQYDGIVIYFGLYEIAPYAAGIRYFKVPFHIFRDLRSDHLRYFAIN
ncbi:MAG TPA: DUF3298 and DUF4163 domain-containing protein [Atribacterota bacterium]|nr:DUF3298 and DUF4163 domain-containing protein [Atribacterota bacterium]